jgi:hypothetical protein
MRLTKRGFFVIGLTLLYLALFLVITGLTASNGPKKATSVSAGTSLQRTR